MKGLRKPVASLLKGRSYAAQAAAASQQQASFQKQDLQISKLPNGMTIATLENYSPITRLAYYFKAGSRYETSNNIGVTHKLRHCSSLRNDYASGFAVTKNIQQGGANFQCTTTRDHMCYSLECLRSQWDKLFKLFTASVMFPAFRRHEVGDVQPHMSLDHEVMLLSPEVQLAEALHQAAYRGGLSNSLYCPPHKFGSHTHEVLRDYVTSHMALDNGLLVGVGIDHDSLSKFASDGEFRKEGSHTVPPSNYHGGEVRIPTASEFVHAAIVTEGVGVSSNDLLSLAVLQRVMGTGPHVKYSSGSAGSKLAQAVTAATQNPFAVTCLNLSHSDTGLFGFQVIGQSADMGPVLKACTKTFADATKGGITDADLAKAKTQLKSDLLMSAETGAAVLDDIAVQVLATGSYHDESHVIASVDAVTLQQVQSIAKKVINSKPSMAAVGDLSSTPYLDEILQ